MGHYEERLAADKLHIRDRVGAVGVRVGRAVSEAVEAMLAGDADRCSAIVLGDLPINREIRAIDARCHAFVARHLPSAGHLRFVSSTMRMTVALERVGDYAVTIAREGVQLSVPPPEAIAASIRELSIQACEMFENALRAYIESDAELARNTKPVAGNMHRSYDRVFRALVALEGSQRLEDLFALLVVMNRLERVSDQAKNICEETLFEVAGETKPPKVYRVLFVDEDNSLLAPLASAIARKSFPKSGAFQAASFEPAAALSDTLEATATRLGLDLTGIAPRPIPSQNELASMHVTVGLIPGVRQRMGEIPFHTVLLDWSGVVGDRSHEADDLMDLGQRLASEVRELMTTMRGEDAD